MTDAAIVAVQLGLLGGPTADSQRRTVYELDQLKQVLLRAVRDLERVTQERDAAQAFAAGAKAKMGAIANVLATHVPLEKRRGLDLRGLTKPLTVHELARIHAVAVAKGLLKPNGHVEVVEAG